MHACECHVSLHWCLDPDQEALSLCLSGELTVKCDLALGVADQFTGFTRVKSSIMLPVSLLTACKASRQAQRASFALDETGVIMS